MPNGFDPFKAVSQVFNRAFSMITHPIDTIEEVFSEIEKNPFQLFAAFASGGLSGAAELLGKSMLNDALAQAFVQQHHKSSDNRTPADIVKKYGQNGKLASNLNSLRSAQKYLNNTVDIAVAGLKSDNIPPTPANIQNRVLLQNGGQLQDAAPAGSQLTSIGAEPA